MFFYEKESEILRRCCFDVQNEVGLGRREQAYHQGCILWLRANRIPYQSKPPHHLRFGVNIAHTLIPDLILWDRVTLELKALRRKLVTGDEVQLFDYLKCRGDRLGLLVNFGMDRVQSKRFIFERPSYRLVEDWHQWNTSTGESRDGCVATCRAFRNLFHLHQTGYGQEVSKKLILGALADQELLVEPHPTAVATFRGQIIDESTIDCLLLNKRIVLVATALLESNNLARHLCASYMKALGTELGLAVNLGKTMAQITGLHHKSGGA